MHSRPSVYRDDALGRWRPVSQSAVGPYRVVVATPAFDQDLSLAQRGEDLAIEQLIAETGVEAFAVAVFPALPGRASHGDVPRGVILGR